MLYRGQSKMSAIRCSLGVNRASSITDEGRGERAKNTISITTIRVQDFLALLRGELSLQQRLQHWIHEEVEGEHWKVRSEL